MNTPAPIIFIVFNRPDHTKQVLEALQANSLAKASTLHIFSDGSRGVQDDEAIANVRNVTRKASGFKEIVWHESAENKGCSHSVLSAIDYILSLYDRCIVVEDDILVSPLFLEYMNAALDYYASNESIFCVGAYRTPFKIPSSYTKDLYLMRRATSWGWGTWKRAWSSISVDPDVIKQDLKDPQIRKAFGEHGEDWLRTFDLVPDIWDLRVSYGIWKSGMYTVLPVQSYAHNIGKDGSGVNYHGAALKVKEDIQFADKLPQFIPLDNIDEAVRIAYKHFTHKPSWRLFITTTAKKIGVYKFLLRIWESFGLH